MLNINFLSIIPLIYKCGISLIGKKKKTLRVEKVETYRMEPRHMVNYYQRVAGLSPNQGSTKKCQIQVLKIVIK